MSRFVKETLPLATYGGGTGLLTIAANNGFNLMHQAHTHLPVMTMMIAPYEMAIGGVAVVMAFNHLKIHGARFRMAPVASGLLLGAAFAAAVTAGSNKADVYLADRVQRSWSQSTPASP